MLGHVPGATRRLTLTLGFGFEALCDRVRAVRKTSLVMCLSLLSSVACGPEPGTTAPPAPTMVVPAPTPPAPVASSDDGFKVLAETVADYQILRYRVPGFDKLTLKEKLLAYHLAEAALAGRDIIFDQKHRHNLAVRKTLEAVLEGYADKSDPDYVSLATYAKRFFIARGIHHDYSSQKMKPDVSKEGLSKLVLAVDAATLPLDAAEGSGRRTPAELVAWLTPLLYDPAVDPINVNRQKDVDVIKSSSNNFYEGVTQKEVEAFYKKKTDPKDERPVSFGLNSKLVKERGKLVEKTWKVGGMYGPAIEKIVASLKEAAALAENDAQRLALEKLVAFYESGDLALFDAYNIAWVKDTNSKLDTINGFIETYGDALGYRATYEAVVQMRDEDRTKRIATIGGAAQWFEDNSPILAAHKKANVVGISAKVITVVMEAGDAAPTTPIGINLPNANWIRQEHGSKSVFLGNIVDAYQETLKDSGILEEFSASKEEVARAKQYGTLAYALKVDMHEVIGHASGQLEKGVATPQETLKNYAAALEEARADLVALYFVMDPKLIELGVMESLEVGKAAYDGYIQNGLLVQLARIEPGQEIAQSHMRNRQLVSAWAFEKGKADNVIERIEKNGDVYFVIRDYAKLRTLWGELLREIQRIKSQGDFEAGKNLIETYGVKVDRAIHDNVLARYGKLSAKPFSAFIQPRLVPVEKDGAIVDVRVEYPDDFLGQQLDYGKQYAFLPTKN